MNGRLVALVISIAGCRSPRPPPVDALAGNYRVATFNVRRLFDTICESGACDSGDYEEQPSQQALDARVAQLATAIRALDADLVSLQEIETQACLDALRAHLGDALPHAVLGEIGTVASVDVAVLSRTPVDEVIRHRATTPLVLSDGRTTTFSRELLEVHVRAPSGTAVVMFAAHFKSKSDDDPLRRLAEAQTSSRITVAAAERQPSALVLLAGDLNDTPGSPPLDALGGLVRLADDLPVAAQATYVFQGRGQAIDHILMVPGGDALRVPESARVWSDGRGWGGSDHAALTSELVLY